METKELIEKYLNRLDSECNSQFDTEVDHINADNILCDLLTELGYKEIVDKFNKIDKWYA